MSIEASYHRIPHAMRDLLDTELTEELLYQTRFSLPSPLNEKVWSKLSVDLMKDTCKHIAQYLHCYMGPLHVRKKILSEKLIEEAEKAAEALQRASGYINDSKNSTIHECLLDDHIARLSFKSNTQKISKKHLRDERNNERMINLYDCSDKTICFGAASAMADIQAYYDSVDLCGIESYYPPSAMKNVSEFVSMVSKYDAGSLANDAFNPSQQFRWMARSVDAFKKGRAILNEQWYLEHQIFLVVHYLATCVGINPDVGYSLEKLCTAIDLDVSSANRAIARGAIKPTWPESEITAAYHYGDGNVDSRRRVRRKAKSRKRTHRSLESFKEKPDHEFPGWLVKRVPRAKSGGDNYWTHPELPGVYIRSKVGVRTMIDYTQSKGADMRAAYEEYKGVTKFFSKSTLSET